MRSDDHTGKTRALRGRTQIVSITGVRFGLNLISAVNRQGLFRFMGVEGRVNAGVFIQLLKRLLGKADRMIYLIVDSYPTHKATKVRKFAASESKGLRLYYLPHYSPELNPSESVWDDLKNNCIGRKRITSPEQI